MTSGAIDGAMMSTRSGVSRRGAVFEIPPRMTYGANMYLLRVALGLVVLHAVGAIGAELECPTFQGTVVPSPVVARTNLGSGRYELAKADRICRPKDGTSLGALRSHDVRGAKPARNLARDRANINLIEGLVDVDISTPIAILLPENPGQPAYACYRLLQELPPGRLCLLADIDGSGVTSGKALLCNRGRCRERKFLGLLSPGTDLFQSVWDAQVTLPGATTAVDAVTLTQRGRVGRLSMDVALDVHDAIDLGIDLRANGLWKVRDGNLVRDGAPILETSGEGHARSNLDTKTVSVRTDLTDVRGTTTIEMTRTNADNPTSFGQCWLFALTDDQGVETTIELPLVVPATGIGASRNTVELDAGGETRSTLDTGNCNVTPTGRIACLIPATAGTVPFDLRLFGALRLPTTTEPAGGAGTFTDLVTPRAGTWTARFCPTTP